MPIKNPTIISEYLQREVGMICEHEVKSPKIQLSLLGAITKKHKPGKWRLIVNLFSPAGAGINDGISAECSSVSYVSIDHLSSLVTSTGRGAFLVKADIKEAYRVLSIHPEDQALLEVCWEGNIYTDRALSFGLRLAPKIFSAVANALQWIVVNKGVRNLLHYLDDFIFISESLEEVSTNKQILVDIYFQSLRSAS